MVKHYDGPYNLKSCGEGCTELWIGRVGNDYWSGNCSIYEEYTRVQVSNPDAIVSATLEYAKWDDYMQVWVGKSGQETKVWSGPDGNFLQKRLADVNCQQVGSETLILMSLPISRM